MILLTGAVPLEASRRDDLADIWDHVANSTFLVSKPLQGTTPHVPRAMIDKSSILVCFFGSLGVRGVPIYTHEPLSSYGNLLLLWWPWGRTLSLPSRCPLTGLLYSNPHIKPFGPPGNMETLNPERILKPLNRRPNTQKVSFFYIILLGSRRAVEGTRKFVLDAAGFGSSPATAEDRACSEALRILFQVVVFLGLGV